MITPDEVRPLSGLRVVEFAGQVAAPLTAMLLGDAGAEVVRIVRPGSGTLGTAASAVLDRSKHTVEIDLKTAAGRAAAERLVDGADVLVEGFRPGVLARLGFGADVGAARNPGLVYCSVPGFSHDDPREGMQGWESIVAAATSIYRPPRLLGPSGPEVGTAPAILDAPLISTYAAIIAAHGVVAALIARERDGLGQTVESSLYDAAFDLLGHSFHGAAMARPGSGFTPPTRPGTAHYRCADGRWIHLCLFDDRHLRWFGDTFAPELAADGWFDATVLRASPDRQDELLETMAGLMATKSAGEWERLINDVSGAPAALCQTASEWLRNDEHARESGAVIAFDDPLLGPTSQLGYGVTLSATPLCAHSRTFGDAPVWEPAASPHAVQSVNAGTEGRFGRFRRQQSEFERTEAARPPLDGVRVVDFTQVLAGPTCARILAEYGASVVKINKPADRGIPWHAWVNRGKKSMLLDIASPESLPVLDALLAEADVVSQNFALGVADRLGIGETAVRGKRPDVIYSSISAFGSQGFRRAWRGREELGQALTGLQHLWAKADGEPAMYVFPVTDVATGHLAAFGILLALFHKGRTGEGQSVSASLSQTGTMLQAPSMIEYPGRVWGDAPGQRHRGWSPGNHLYRGSDDRWLAVVANGIFDPIEWSFATKSAAESVTELLAAGHSAHLVQLGDEMANDPIAVERGISLGDNVGIIKRLSRSPLPPFPPTGAPGSDSKEILATLNLTDRWAHLVESGAIVAVA
jgi:crotonobetainyl-CoA:carnitine CoA-transferase CaiB-like acyl-CoA transferase